MPVLDIPGLIVERVLTLRAYHADCKLPKAELDLSGGVDSAVMAGLLVMALGPENVTLVHTNIETAPDQTDRAQRLADALKCPLVYLDLTPLFHTLIKEMEGAACSAGMIPNTSPEVLGSIKSCIRAPIGRGFNRMAGNGIRHGTGNECEDRFLRYFQKGGDGEVDTNPLEMFSKTEVYQLAWGLGEQIPEARSIYRELITVTPTADLWGPGKAQNDEGELKTWLGAAFTYGKVSPETGEILEYGTIERVSRFLDTDVTLLSFKRPWDDPFPIEAEVLLFQGNEKRFVHDWPYIVQAALAGSCFNGMCATDVETLLLAARKAERATRHKANDNIPTLGSREDLVPAGLLSNDLLGSFAAGLE